MSGSVVAVAQIITSLASAVFFIAAACAVIQDFTYIHPEDKPAEDEHSRKTFKKCMLLTAGGVFMYFLSRICVNIPEMAGSYGIAVIAFQALLDTVYKVGFLLLLPIVIRFWRKFARRRTYS